MENPENQTIRNCRFAYKCEKTWDDLIVDASSSRSVRFCDDCEKSVFLCETDTELAKAIRLNRCVAIVTPFDRLLPTSGRRATSSENMTVGLPSGPPYEVDDVD